METNQHAWQHLPEEERESLRTSVARFVAIRERGIAREAAGRFIQSRKATPAAPEARNLQPEASPDSHGELGKPGGSPQPATIQNSSAPAGSSDLAGSRRPEEQPRRWEELSVEERAKVRKRLWRPARRTR